MCVMVTQNYMNFCEGYNDTSLRLSRYAYYTVMYTACHNLMSNCPCKVHMTGYGLAYFSTIELVKKLSLMVYMYFI